MLSIRNLNAYYGQVPVLYGVDIEVREGDIVGLVGANAAGKTTTLMTVAGLRTRCTGEIRMAGERIDSLAAHDRVARGIVLIPERRRLFPFMTVLENLELGAFCAGARQNRGRTLEMVFDLLPILAERRDQVAGSLSGGEQQMCAIGRGLMARPRVLMLDEPTEGLAPIYVLKVFDLVVGLRDEGMTILLVEQNVQHVLRIADRAYVLENGRITMEDTGPKLLVNPKLKAAYLGL
jgi:branched-chain amino acid transport system ATP-binding protein